MQVFSAPMGQIFDRLQAFGEFEVGERLRVFEVIVLSPLILDFGFLLNLEIAEFDCFISFVIVMRKKYLLYIKSYTYTKIDNVTFTLVD